MTELNKIITRLDAIIVGVLLLIMMVIGSIWDYPISLALHDSSNPFGIFFAAYGEAPALLGLVMSGTLLLSGCSQNHERKHVGILQVLCGTLLILIGGILLLILPGHYINLPSAIISAIGTAIIMAVIFMSIRISRHADHSDIVKVAAAIFVIILLEMILVNIVKILWGRPRMRLIASDGELSFIPWWVIDRSLKQKLIAAGVAGEELKSFPSGHTSNAAVLILLSLFPILNNALRQKGRLFFYIGVTWGGVVALSRIIIGAHFVTDTVVGFSVTFVITLIMQQLMLSHNKNNFTKNYKAQSKHRTNSQSSRTD